METTRSGKKASKAAKEWTLVQEVTLLRERRKRKLQRATVSVM